jgi:putative membrane protein
MKTKLLVVALSMACMVAMLAGMSIAQDQTTGGNSNSSQGSNRNSNRGGSATAMQGPSSADTKFAMMAAMDSMTEVELGRLAVQKGTSDAVKQFGQRMIDDHTNANQQLMQLASSKGMTLPTTLDAKHAAMVQKFQRLEGAEFDRQYAKAMVDDHKKAVAMFQKEANSGMDADLKAFASQTLPVLQGHLSMAQAMSGSGMRSANANSNMSGSSNGNMSGGNTNSNRSGNTNSNMNSNSNSNGNMNRSGNGNANNSNQR